MSETRAVRKEIDCKVMKFSLSPSYFINVISELRMEGRS